MKTLLWIVIIIVLGFGGKSYYKFHQAALVQQETDHKKQEAEKHKQAIEQRAKDDIKARLKDPESAQFKIEKVSLDHAEVVVIKGKNESFVQNVVCGQVNSKNSFGGYVGFKHFIWHSYGDEPGQVDLADESELALFLKRWKTKCN